MKIQILLANFLATQEVIFPKWNPAPLDSSRSPCPVLNSLANHDLLPRSGRNITSNELDAALTFLGISKTIRRILVKGVPSVLDLNDLDAHNWIEHDASLSRLDYYDGDNHSFDFDQFSIGRAFTNMEKPRSLSLTGFARWRNQVLNNCLFDNPECTFNAKQNVAATAEASLLYLLFKNSDGLVSFNTLTDFFVNEKFPNNVNSISFFQLATTMSKLKWHQR